MRLVCKIKIIIEMNESVQLLGEKLCGGGNRKLFRHQYSESQTIIVILGP